MFIGLALYPNLPFKGSTVDNRHSIIPMRKSLSD